MSICYAPGPQSSHSDYISQHSVFTSPSPFLQASYERSYLAHKRSLLGIRGTMSAATSNNTVFGREGLRNRLAQNRGVNPRVVEHHLAIEKHNHHLVSRLLKLTVTNTGMSHLDPRYWKRKGRGGGKGDGKKREEAENIERDNYSLAKRLLQLSLPSSTSDETWKRHIRQHQHLLENMSHRRAIERKAKTPRMAIAYAHQQQHATASKTHHKPSMSSLQAAAQSPHPPSDAAASSTAGDDGSTAPPPDPHALYVPVITLATNGHYDLHWCPLLQSPVYQWHYGQIPPPSQKEAVWALDADQRAEYEAWLQHEYATLYKKQQEECLEFYSIYYPHLPVDQVREIMMRQQAVQVASAESQAPATTASTTTAAPTVTQTTNTDVWPFTGVFPPLNTKPHLIAPALQNNTEQKDGSLQQQQQQQHEQKEQQQKKEKEQLKQKERKKANKPLETRWQSIDDHTSFVNAHTSFSPPTSPRRNNTSSSAVPTISSLVVPPSLQPHPPVNNTHASYSRPRGIGEGVPLPAFKSEVIDPHYVTSKQSQLQPQPPRENRSAHGRRYTMDEYVSSSNPARTAITHSNSQTALQSSDSTTALTPSPPTPSSLVASPSISSLPTISRPITRPSSSSTRRPIEQPPPEHDHPHIAELGLPSSPPSPSHQPATATQQPAPVVAQPVESKQQTDEAHAGADSRYKEHYPLSTQHLMEATYIPPEPPSPSQSSLRAPTPDSPPLWSDSPTLPPLPDEPHPAAPTVSLHDDDEQHHVDASTPPVPSTPPPAISAQHSTPDTVTTSTPPQQEQQHVEVSQNKSSLNFEIDTESLNKIDSL